MEQLVRCKICSHLYLEAHIKNEICLGCTETLEEERKKEGCRKKEGALCTHFSAEMGEEIYKYCPITICAFNKVFKKKGK